MGLGGVATYLTEAQDRPEIRQAVDWAKNNGNLPIIMIGHGSNIIWRDEGFNGLIIINKIQFYQTFNEDDENLYVTAGSGEIWDTVVERTVQHGLTGIEALSLIPGTAGATPLQNVGAYGQEISNVLVSVEAYDRQTDEFVNIPASDCGFGYRMSRFKTVDKDRFFISGITLHLTKGKMKPPFYSSLQKYLDAYGITDYSPVNIRKAVIDIRSHKLPDPAQVHNCGSFFANPILKEEDFTYIYENFPGVPHWPAGTGEIKIPAAWLIEQTGFKDYHDSETGMGTWPKHPLVLVNESAISTASLVAFRQKIIDAVHAKFGITLVQEPVMLP
jgi:UDP-N-acetylmuramate dehydrogenase